jgi:PKD repeat protein
MKNKIYLILVTLLALGVTSCEAPVIERPDPFRKVPPIEVVMDFTYRESPNPAGQVRFSNKSKGIQSFLWDFGFKNTKGEPVTSQETSPKIYYPANGYYPLTLKGIDLEGKERILYRTVVIIYKN